MSAYNFQAQFAPLVESGAKRSTIRRRRKNGYIPAVGERVKLYTGQRTRACRLLREVKVVAVHPITINADNGAAEVILAGERMSHSQVYALATADGFKTITEFANFFSEKYGPQLQAYLIRWVI